LPDVLMMRDAFDFEIDRVMAEWPRFHGLLRSDPRLFLKAFEIVRALERRLATGDTAAKALAQIRGIARLNREDRRQLARAATADLAARRVGQLDLLDSKRVATLAELLTEVRAQFGEPAATSFESGEDVRPRFRDVSDVFVAYHRETAMTQAYSLVKDIEGWGHSCCIAPRDIPKGHRWNKRIHRAIAASREMILLLTREALESSYIEAEVQHAFDNGKRVIVLHLEPDLDAKWLFLPLCTVQHIEWHFDPEAAIAELRSALQGGQQR
jgi:hypothetical protein